MTDNSNLEELENGELGHEQDDFGGQQKGLRSSLQSAWRTQPLIKLLVLMVVVAAVVAVVMGFLSNTTSGPKQASSTFGKPPPLHEAPGGKASAYVKQETRMANEQREKDAMTSGASSLPTPIGADTTKKDDPLNELRTEIENLTKEVNRPRQQPQPQPAQQRQAQPQPQPAAPFDEGLSKAMQKQMSELMVDWKPKGIRAVGVSKGLAGDFSGSLDKPMNATQVSAQGKDLAAAGAPASQGSTPKILVPAGTISYAKLLTEANSDVPGPILAQIVSGPLNGARAIGKFSVQNAYSDYLILRFSLAELDGKEYQINTLAIDPDTSLGGMATDVDERYFERVFLPAAAAFVQGVGSALGQDNTSITTNGSSTIATQTGGGIHRGLYKGLESAAGTVSQFAQSQANQTKPLVVVAAGTPMGLLFVTSVRDQPPPQGSMQGLGMRGASPQYQGLAGYSGTDASIFSDNGPYPGTTVNGFGGGQSMPYQMPNLSALPSMSYNPYRYGSMMPGLGAPH